MVKTTSSETVLAHEVAQAPVVFQDLREAMGVVQHNVKGLFDAHSAQTLAAQANLNSMLTDSLNEGLGSVERRVLERVARAESEAARAHDRLSGHDAQIQALLDKQREMEARLAGQGSEVARMQSAVRVEASTLDPSYDRAPDATVLRLNTTGHEVQKAKVEECCAEWLDGIVGRDGWVVSGPNTGKRFAIRFAGLPRTAQASADNAVNNLRPATHGGAWKDLSVQTEDGSRTKLYINKDASPMQLRLALVARVTRDVLKAAKPALSISVVAPQYHAGKTVAAFLRFDAMDVVEITAVARDLEPVIKFCLKFLHAYGLERDVVIATVRTRMASRGRTTDTTSWV